MTEQELSRVCSYIIDNIMYNEIYWDLFHFEGIDIIDIIAGLFEMLHYEVTGEHYDYMWHWCNKMGGWCDTEYLYKECNIEWSEDK